MGGVISHTMCVCGVITPPLPFYSPPYTPSWGYRDRVLPVSNAPARPLKVNLKRTWARSERRPGLWPCSRACQSCRQSAGSRSCRSNGAASRQSRHASKLTRVPAALAVAQQWHLRQLLHPLTSSLRAGARGGATHDAHAAARRTLSYTSCSRRSSGCSLIVDVI